MALLRGAHRLNLRVCGRAVNRPCPPVGVRSLSDKVSPKAETASGPDEPLLYTAEHFALKESLRKVRRCTNFGFTLKKHQIMSCCKDAAEQ